MLVAQLCPTLCDPMDCSPPGSSVHEIVQARILEGAAISFPSGSSQPRDWTQVSCTAGRFFIDWATREAQRLRRRRKNTSISHGKSNQHNILFKIWARFPARAGLYEEKGKNFEYNRLYIKLIKSKWIRNLPICEDSLLLRKPMA